MIHRLKNILSAYKVNEYVKNHRSLLTIFLFIAGILIILIYAGGKSASIPEGKVPFEGRAAAFVYTEQVTLNGNSWKNIENLDVSFAQKFLIKTRVLKITLESSLFSGNPIITPTTDISEYVLSVDRFYADNDNIEMPIFFALKVADLIKNNTPEFLINSYTSTIKGKLREVGVIQ